MTRPVPSAAAVRQRFVDFFVERGHTHVASSSLVPENDPTLLFVNAGMNQFKDVFTGRETRPYTRAVTVQRCLRAGGKHNDLDNVGFTPRHQTLFEMLGNFSFGDYFKADAIAWGWEFLTEDLRIPAERLVATVFSGEGEDAPADDEAFELWRRFLPEGRIYRCSAKDNFWQMGDTGPCGPCSEIHLYAGDAAPSLAGQPGRGPAHEDDRYLELWNLVFMQYEKRAGEPMIALPKPSIDTGSGLERVAATVAGVSSNYETDLLSPMVERVRGLVGADGVRSEAPLRVIADHARAAAFLIADGVFPDKDGRSYVLRRIMRRAIRHGTEIGLSEPFFDHVCQTVIEVFGEVYPVLQERASSIREVVRAEEDAFRRTLDRGLRLLDRVFDDMPVDQSVFDPAVAADLYSTYGFPLDLTGIIAGERGKSLDEEAARELTRGGGGRGADLGSERRVEDVYFRVRAEVGDTEFCGYEHEQTSSLIRALVVDGASVDVAQAGQDVEVILDTSAFYAEGGGQVGDAGVLRAEGGEVAISDTRKPVGAMHVHRGRVVRGSVRVGQTLSALVDTRRRDAIRRHHSATHLLHLALRTELGDHVMQKGSAVGPDRLRFDFSHGRPLTAEQVQRIETHVNRLALSNAVTSTELMTPDEAKSAGAIGLFDAKYGDTVRVVRIGGDSLELCGGTHVFRAGDIGLFTIVSETNVAAGVRRIEAVTGLAALEHVQSLTSITQEAMARLHAGQVSAVPERIEKLQADLKGREREIEDLRRQLATGGSAPADEIREVAGIKLLAKRVAVGDAKALRSAADVLRDRLGSGVVVLGAENDGKATLLVAVTRDLTSRVHAGKLVGALAARLDGRGGGRPDLAQAGGPNVGALDAAIASTSSTLERLLSGA